MNTLFETGQPRYTLHQGDSREVLKGMADASVDSIVCDPPYELGFMGKSWDNTGIANDVTLWREALRVLKPGGHLLAFSGTRTYHRMVCAIEDAGFEIRDQIGWVYGSGFPKSLDVSKAIDKAGGDALAWRAFSAAYAAAVEASPLTHSDIDRALGIKSSSCYWARTDHRGGMPPRHHWEKVRDLLTLPDHFVQLYDEAEREVIGHRERGFAPGSNAVYGDYSGDTRITAPSTEAARQWQGWGTALKPAWEPICLARKPLAAGTVAANVLAHGTGALNIDGCRIEAESGGRPAREVAPMRDGVQYKGQVLAGRLDGSLQSSKAVGVTALGRWPANLAHDGSDEVLALFPESTSGAMKAGTQRAAQDEPGSVCFGTYGGNATSTEISASSGSAARFFYCAKASKEDRNEGCDGLPLKTGGMVSNTSGQHITRRDGGAPGPTANRHPTVKPTDLMAYLCRLVTPPGGIVLDPFMGSGSTGKAAMLEGFNFIGIDLSAEYIEIARARIDHALRQGHQPSLLEAA